MTIVTHVGLTVPDLPEAVSWYCDILGFQLLAGPFHSTFSEKDSSADTMTKDLLGEDITEMRNAHLLADNQIGLELFSFPGAPRVEQPPLWQPGFFHLCITAQDVQAMADHIASHGGKQRSKVWNTWPGKPYYLVYCEDPFGNIIEIYSHTTEQMYANKE